jgi:hypothetical protein
VPLRARLFALAASLPRAVPACPKERPPARTDPDAQGWPVDAPVDAPAGPPARPCR